MRIKREDIYALVKEKMSEKRFNHVLGVVDTAVHLAKMHHIDVNSADIAALIHDVSKEQPLQQTAGLLRIAGLESYLEHSDKVWHAPMGALFSKEVFGIEDEDVLNAVRYHTTGRPQMSAVEKVLFVADYTEPNRKFEGAQIVRKLWHDLDSAVCEILKQKVEKVQALGLGMHPDTLSAYDYYKAKTKK